MRKKIARHRPALSTLICLAVFTIFRISNCTFDSPSPANELSILPTTVRDSSIIIPEAIKSKMDSIAQQFVLDSIKSLGSSLNSLYLRYQVIERLIIAKDLEKASQFLEISPDSAFHHHEVMVHFLMAKSNYFFTTKRYEEGISFADSAYNICTSIFFSYDSLPVAILDQMIRIARYQLRDAKLSLSLLKKQAIGLKNIPNLAKYHRNNLYNFATTYRISGDYSRSLLYAKQLLHELMLDKEKPDSVYLASVYKLLGNIYTDLEEYNRSFEFLKKSIDIKITLGTIASVDLSNFAIQCSKNLNFQLAENYLSLAYSMIENDEDSYFYNRTTAFHYLTKDEPDSAENYIKTALTYSSTNKDRYLYPFDLSWIGEYYDLQDSLELANHFYLESFYAFAGVRDLNKINIEELNQISYIPLIISLNLRIQGRLFERDKLIKHLTNAKKWIYLGNALAEKTTRNITETTTLNQLAYWHEFNGYASYINYLLYVTTGSKSSLDEFDKQIVKSRSERAHFLGNSDLDRNGQHILQNLVNEEERDLNARSNTIMQTLTKLDSLDLLPRETNVSSPVSDTGNSVSEIVQSLLHNSDSISYIIYHWTRKKIFQYVISGRRINVFTQKTTIDLIGLLDDFHQVLTEPIDVSNKPQINKYINLGYQLYCLLVQPIEDNLSEHFVIYPDGPLLSVPFGAFIMESSKLTDFRLAAYLVNTYTIDSRVDFSNMEARTISDSNSTLAYIYGNPTTRTDLINLPGTLHEGKMLHKKIQEDKLTVLSGEEATLADFITAAPKYEILYLATHAKSNPYNRFENYIVFPNSKEMVNEKLDIETIIGMAIRPKLVILSACETSRGKFYRGFGVMSLERAFHEKGAFVISSMWPVSDQINAKYMDLLTDFLFINNHNIVMSNNLACRAWIKESDIYLSQPYFWAGYCN